MKSNMHAMPRRPLMPKLIMTRAPVIDFGCNPEPHMQSPLVGRGADWMVRL